MKAEARKQRGTTDIKDRVVAINRVAKVVKGGRRFGFTALVVAGDGAGHAGMGLGKAREVAEAVRKGIEQAKKAMVRIPMKGGSIPHEVIGTFGASRVFLKPAAPGTGVIACAPIRAVMELGGVSDVVTKSLGSSNRVNTVRATLAALSELERAEKRVQIRREGGSGDSLGGARP